MTPPINQIFKFLQQQSTINIWLYDQTEVRLTGKIRGFDEFMNIVVEDAVEVNSNNDHQRKLGRLLLKGENITLISSSDTD